MEIVENLVKSTLAEIEKVLTTRTVVGDPITFEGTTLIPLISVGLGFAAGGGEGKAEDGTGAGGGAGAGVTPVAVMVIHQNIPGPEGIQIFTLGKKGEVAQAISTAAESLPSVIEAIRGSKQE